MSRAMEVAAGYSSQEDEAETEEGSLLGSARGSPKPGALAKYSRKHAAASAVGIACLVGAAAALALHGSMQPATTSVPAGPVTVRSLLEGDELTDLATDNLMVMGSDAVASAGRDQVRGRVARGLRNISDTIRTRYPEAHHQLELLQLTGGQKEAALRVLRKFGDPRMVSLTHDIAETTRQAKEQNGDSESLKRRLSEKLVPKLREVQQLSEEMFPGQSISVGADALPQLRKWHPTVEVDFSDAATKPQTERRRLSEAGDGIEQGVQAHAQTLFKSLHHELGSQMPAAPARMLSSDDDSDASFMTCVMKAVPNPVSVCSCIASNMSEVISMMTSFMKSKTL